MRWDTQQLDELMLKVGEFGIEDLDGFATDAELVTFGVTEETQYLFSGWMGAQTLLRIKREFTDTVASHSQPEFALYQGLHEQGQKVQREQGLDPGLVLEEYRVPPANLHELAA